MKQLILIIVLIIKTIVCFGQIELPDLEDWDKYTLAYPDSLLIDKSGNVIIVGGDTLEYSTGEIILDTFYTPPYKTRLDTYKVVMLLCDTARPYRVIQNCYNIDDTIPLPYYRESLWEYGYEVVETKYLQTVWDMYQVDYGTKNYLGKDKRRLPKKYVVWISLRIKN